MTSNKNCKPFGKVESRFNESRGKYRLRFYAVAPDHRETILMALERARKEAGTEYDAVALDAICMNYLSGGNVTKAQSLGSVLSQHSREEILAALETLSSPEEIA